MRVAYLRLFSLTNKQQPQLGLHHLPTSQQYARGCKTE